MIPNPIRPDDIQQNEAIFWNPKFHGIMFALCTSYVIQNAVKILQSEATPYRFESFISNKAKRIDLGCTIAVTGIALGFLIVTVILLKTRHTPPRNP
ncbi:MAG: hypothetical protein LLG04_16150 [Parachlamydia sp.]|nr:hypothetical protein [Parachlamydia sp.]